MPWVANQATPVVRGELGLFRNINRRKSSPYSLHAIFVWTVGCNLFLPVEHAWADKDNTQGPSDNAAQRAFQTGASLKKGEDGSLKIDINRSGHNLRFVGTYNEKKEAYNLTCLLCTNDEMLATARSMGATLRAKSLGKDPARLSISNLGPDGYVYVDGMPFTPPKKRRSIESGPHTIEIIEKERTIETRITLTQGELAQVDTTKLLPAWKSHLRYKLLLGGLGLTAAAIGGVFLGLHDTCATGKDRDAEGNCRELHNLDEAGWSLIATGALSEVMMLIWFLWTNERDTPVGEKNQ